MIDILELDAWLLGFALFVLMSLAWWAGSRMPFHANHDKPEGSHIESAALALFGLLLAFCFAGAAARYEARKDFLLDDAVAIGDFATTASALEDPLKSELRAEVIRYVDQRLLYARTRFDDPAMPGLVAQARHHHDRLLELVRRAINEKNTPTIHAPLLNAYNGLTMSHDRRLYGSQNHVPATIIVMLVTLAIYASFVLARMSGQHACQRPIMARAFAYLALVSIVFVVTIDLDQPRRGMMRVSQIPMEDLRMSLTDQGLQLAPR
jgi:hypothetical protein